MPALARPSLPPAFTSNRVRLGAGPDPRVEHAARLHLKSRQEADTLTGLQRQTATRLHANRPHDGNHPNSLVTRRGFHRQILQDEIILGWYRIKTGGDRTDALDNPGRVSLIGQTATTAADCGDAITGLRGDGKGGGGTMGDFYPGRTDATASSSGSHDGVAVPGHVGVRRIPRPVITPYPITISRTRRDGRVGIASSSFR